MMKFLLIISKLLKQSCLGLLFLFFPQILENHKTYILEGGQYIDILTHVSYTQNGLNNKAIALINPFRYRGYYFDIETNLYYLNTRYYDPEIGRFLNADTLDNIDENTTNGMNLYFYCGSNPINYADPNGDKPKWWQWLFFGIGAALVVTAAVVLTIVSGGSALSLVGAITIGAAKGALIGAAIGTAIGIAGGAIYSAVTGADMGRSILSGFLMGFGIGAIFGAAIGGAIGGISYTNAANAWNGGEKSMLEHFTKHGKAEMGYNNPVKYTKDALKIVKNGSYYAQKNAYVTAYNLTKKAVNFVGVTQAGTHLTTFSIRTLTRTTLKLLGLL